MTEKEKNLQLEQYGFGPNVMKKTKVCLNCGQLARARSMICSHCGARLPFVTLFDSYKRRHPCCPHCSTILTADAKYCPHCGQLINTADHLLDGDADMYVRLRWGMILSFVIGIVLVAIGAVCLIIRAKM